MSEELAIEMKHADVMQVHYRTKDQKLGNVYGTNFEAYEVRSVTSTELEQVDVIEDEMQLVYVNDCPNQISNGELWREIMPVALLIIKNRLANHDRIGASMVSTHNKYL